VKVENIFSTGYYLQKTNKSSFSWDGLVARESRRGAKRAYSVELAIKAKPELLPKRLGVLEYSLQLIAKESIGASESERDIAKIALRSAERIRQIELFDSECQRNESMEDLANIFAGFNGAFASAPSGPIGVYLP
jgi:hypothetical protein